MAPFDFVRLVREAETFFGENHLKRGTLVFFGLDFQMCLMLHQYMFDDGKSQTGTTSTATAV